MTLIDAVQAAGVVGAGGAGFPTHVKLSAKADCFIVNAAECEPLIETDKYLCRTYARELAAATSMIAGHLGAKRAVIALKRTYTAEITALENAIAATGAEIELYKLDPSYPAGDEQTIVSSVLDVTVPERGLPLDVGAVVDNAGTVLSVWDALQSKPVTEKLLSVVGEVKQNTMVKAPIGTPVRDCIDAVGASLSRYAVIMGGPMMGRMLTGEEIQKAVVTKTTGNLLVLPEDHYLVTRQAVSMARVAMRAKSACIQCRMCTDLCPRYILGHQIRPHLVMRSLWREQAIADDTAFEQAFGDAANCCDCGACEMFSCPMGLAPRRVNGYIKGKLKERGINPERNLSPTIREHAQYRRIPTGRLVARLGLKPYYGRPLAPEVREIVPQTVRIPLRQHIGKPAEPVKSPGERVIAGELAARAAEGLSANIHTGITGIVTAVDGDSITIRREM